MSKTEPENSTCKLSDRIHNVKTFVSIDRTVNFKLINLVLKFLSNEKMTHTGLLVNGKIFYIWIIPCKLD